MLLVCCVEYEINMFKLMSTHNLCFRAKIREKNGYPCAHSFTIQKLGVRGYSLHGLVFVMLINSRFAVYCIGVLK